VQIARLAAVSIVITGSRMIFVITIPRIVQSSEETPPSTEALIRLLDDLPVARVPPQDVVGPARLTRRRR
jgi:hypothetical protein